MFRRFLIGGAAAVVLALGSSAFAAVFAQYVNNSFTQGTLVEYNQQFDDPTVLGTVLDGPNAVTNAGNPVGVTGLPGYTEYPYQGIVSPFNDPYDVDQVVDVGIGGSITVKFPQPVNTGTIPSIGVFTSIALNDSNYGSAIADDPADTLGDYVAVVSVSADGVNWKSLGVQTFDIPENYYLNAATAYDTDPPADPQVADFGQPFTGTLASFNGEDYPQILATLNGSAGGDWLDLTGLGLTQISYVQFTEPQGVVPDGSYISLEAVTASDIDVPEPVGAAAVLTICALLLPRRRTAAA